MQLTNATIKDNNLRLEWHDGYTYNNVEVPITWAMKRINVSCAIAVLNSVNQAFDKWHYLITNSKEHNWKICSLTCTEEELPHQFLQPAEAIAA